MVSSSKVELTPDESDIKDMDSSCPPEDNQNYLFQSKRYRIDEKYE